MPDILTRANKPLQIECQFCDFRGNIEQGAKHRRETQHLIRIAVPALESPRNAQKVSEAVSEGENQSSAKSEAVVTAPETIRISLPALRSVILAAIDDGDEASDKASGVIFRLPWPIDHPWADVANDARLRFCNEIERRLRQLPVRG